MTLLELGRSTGAVSLDKLLDAEHARTQADELTIPDLVDITCIGGWRA